MDIPQQPSAPAPAPAPVSPAPRGKGRTIAATLFVVIILALGAYFWTEVSSFLLGVFKPGLSGITLTDDADQGPAYALGLFGPVTARTPFADEEGEGYVRAKGPYTARAVYGEGVRTALASWEVELTNTTTKEVLRLGKGHSAHFFTRDGAEHLLYLAPEGVAIVDPAAKTAVTTFLPVYADTRTTVTIAADGTHLVLQDPTTYRYSVFAIESLSPLVIEPLGFLEEGVTSVGFSSHRLVGLKENALYWYELAGGAGTKAYDLPPGHEYRIIPR